jgi:hypothetical protein
MESFLNLLNAMHLVTVIDVQFAGDTLLGYDDQPPSKTQGKSDGARV